MHIAKVLEIARIHTFSNAHLSFHSGNFVKVTETLIYYGIKLNKKFKWTPHYIYKHTKKKK